jgi:hypothetical protein
MALAQARPAMLNSHRPVQAGNVSLVLSGRIEREHVADLERLIDDEAPHALTLDLENVLLDREAVGMLVRCAKIGIRLEN